MSSFDFDLQVQVINPALFQMYEEDIKFLQEFDNSELPPVPIINIITEGFPRVIYFARTKNDAIAGYPRRNAVENIAQQSGAELIPAMCHIRARMHTVTAPGPRDDLIRAIKNAENTGDNVCWSVELGIQKCTTACTSPPNTPISPRTPPCTRTHSPVQEAVIPSTPVDVPVQEAVIPATPVDVPVQAAVIPAPRVSKKKRVSLRVLEQKTTNKRRRV